jgi:NADPH-dependent 7-cyano-7-deazaguanine reductase QueF
MPVNLIEDKLKRYLISFTEHLDHFESLIEELETISRASACPWAQVRCFLTSPKIQEMCRELIY